MSITPPTGQSSPAPIAAPVTPAVKRRRSVGRTLFRVLVGVAIGAVLLAHPWENDVELTGWWMSEKLDGVRAYWDGKQFLSRQGPGD